MENNLMVYQSVITDIKNIINAGQQEAYGAASKAMVLTYWNVGKRIVEQEQAGKEHAEYGKKLLVCLLYTSSLQRWMEKLSTRWTVMRASFWH